MRCGVFGSAVTKRGSHPGGQASTRRSSTQRPQRGTPVKLCDLGVLCVQTFVISFPRGVPRS